MYHSQEFGNTLAVIARTHIPLFVALVLLLSDDNESEVSKGSKETLTSRDDDLGLTTSDSFPSGKIGPI